MGFGELSFIPGSLCRINFQMERLNSLKVTGLFIWIWDVLCRSTSIALQSMSTCSLYIWWKRLDRASTFSVSIWVNDPSSFLHRIILGDLWYPFNQHSQVFTACHTSFGLRVILWILLAKWSDHLFSASLILSLTVLCASIARFFDVSIVKSSLRKKN